MKLHGHYYFDWKRVLLGALFMCLLSCSDFPSSWQVWAPYHYFFLFQIRNKIGIDSFLFYFSQSFLGLVLFVKNYTFLVRKVFQIGQNKASITLHVCEWSEDYWVSDHTCGFFLVDLPLLLCGESFINMNGKCGQNQKRHCLVQEGQPLLPLPITIIIIKKSQKLWPRQDPQLSHIALTL